MHMMRCSYLRTGSLWTNPASPHYGDVIAYKLSPTRQWRHVNAGLGDSSIPKLTYTLRSARCYSRQLLAEYDDVLRSALRISEASVDGRSLGASDFSGGKRRHWGIRRATQVALPAFLSSVAGSQCLIAHLLPGHVQHVSNIKDRLATCHLDTAVCDPGLLAF
jgi:hypothetical protein